MPGLNAANAYRKTAAYRSSREQEAEVFWRVNAKLRNSAQNTLEAARALADNERLWITVMDLLRDPTNRLPAETRATLLSIGHAVRREVRAPEPDYAFLIGINEQVGAGLAGT